MRASVLDLRYKMNDVLKALDRREKVIILYHGKVKGMIYPSGNERAMKVQEHPFFGMNAREDSAVARQMELLRGSRFDAV
jgi:hypothetical protein